MKYNKASFGRCAIIRHNARYLKWKIICIELLSGISSWALIHCHNQWKYHTSLCELLFYPF